MKITLNIKNKEELNTLWYIFECYGDGGSVDSKEKEMCLKCQKQIETYQTIIERFENLEPFQSEEDIPEIPKIDDDIYKNIIIPNLIRCGAIPKKDLKIGTTYIGDTRNASEATWNGKVFEYKRYKWGSYFNDTVNHFEDDNGFALFVPIKIKE